MKQPSFELELSVPESWRDSFITRGVGHGLVEICCWPSPPLLEAAAFTVALAPLGVGSGWAFPHLVLIFPVSGIPPEDALGLETNLWRRIDELLTARMPPEQVQRGLEMLRKRVCVLALDVHDTDVLVNAVRELPERTALFIGRGELFSSAAVAKREADLRAPTPMGEELHLRLVEDIWVPQVHHIARLLGSIASERMLYVVLRVGHYQPERPENLTLLESTDGCNILATRSVEGHSLSPLDWERWTGLMRQGRASDVLAEIDMRAELSALNQAFLKAQCLLAAGQGMLAFQYIEPFLEQMSRGDDPHLLLTVSRMALYAGKLDEASAFLAGALQQPQRDEETLTAALQIATALRVKEQVAAIRDELVRRYPRSEPAMREIIGPILQERRFGEVEAKLAPIVQGGATVGYVRYIYLLARAFQGQTEPDYPQFIEEVKQSGVASPSVAALDSARDLFARRVPERAVELIAGFDWEPAFLPDAVDMVMEGMQQLIIARRSTQKAEDTERLFNQLRRALALVLRYLSDHPEDGERRVEFARLLTPEGGGSVGFRILVESVLRERIPSHCGPEVRTPKPEMPEDFASAILPRLLPKAGRLLLGVGELSLEGIPYSPAELLAFISEMLEYLSTRAEDEGDITSMTQLLHVALLLLRQEERSRSEALRLMNLVGTGLCFAGHFQGARDLVERGLKLAEGGEPSHKRKAWVLFADIYLRTHNRLEALLGLACARQQTDVQLSLEDAYAESVLVARLFRELGHAFREPTLEAVTMARELLAGTSFEAANAQQMDTLECTIEFQAALAKFATGEADAGPSLQALGARLADTIDRSVARRQDLAPPMTLLAQVISYAESVGSPVEPRIHEVFESRLWDLPQNMRETATALSRQKLSVLPRGSADWALGEARFAQDLASDLAMQRLLACRALVDAEARSPELVAFALEWLADHSIRNVDESLESAAPSSREEGVASRLLQWASLGSVQANSQALAHLQDFALRVEEQYRERAGQLQPRLPKSPEEVAQFLVRLSQRLDVHLLGLNHEHHLVHLTASQGMLAVRVEPPDVFQHQAYLDWRQKHPYAYGKMDTSVPEGLSEVERSMAGLGIQASEGSNPSLLVLDTDLQELPANLLPINQELAGLARPMATTPALSWLRACHLVPRPPTSRKVAWVSTATPSTEELGPLLFLAADIEDVCSRMGFMVSNAPKPPPELGGADVAVIGAHGVLHSGDRFFQAVSDEDVTRLTGRDIARHVAGSGVAVLLVCSGGRMDRDFLNNATVGLPRLLLEYGCRAVVASPWSLHVSVARRWLPSFLEALDAGFTIIEATHRANQEVGSKLGRHPSLQLAMHVFGDPLFSLHRTT
ncbi:CHAT domain-containing protein [Archangium sp.]|uniref:CHAT domain-containing protein n=1 Tax=Archangium sp. TaxID=1872627 RepID=UPI002D3F34C6|nr:CHAT domain-containing protein [Archangium sp.]HYO59053.1 CHAT domain-containing protein [Archangium sp.]